TGGRSIAGTGGRSIAGTGVRSADAEVPSLVLFGPVLEIGESSVNVLGLEIASEGGAADASLVGKSAYAEIALVDGALTLLSLSATDELSVPGASSVFVSGTVDGVSDTGQVSIGGLAIDANNLRV